MRALDQQSTRKLASAVSTKRACDAPISEHQEVAEILLRSRLGPKPLQARTLGRPGQGADPRGIDPHDVDEACDFRGRARIRLTTPANALIALFLASRLQELISSKGSVANRGIAVNQYDAVGRFGSPSGSKNFARVNCTVGWSMSL